jgi:hypothetical protein
VKRVLKKQKYSSKKIIQYNRDIQKISSNDIGVIDNWKWTDLNKKSANSYGCLSSSRSNLNKESFFNDLCGSVSYK